MGKATVRDEQFLYTEHERKPVIRSQWCLPQLQLLHAKAKQKLIYVGLPGIEALDVTAWMEYLTKVIAFQCSEYKEGRTIKKIDVSVLDNLLETYERQGLLKSSIVYQGFMEDIVLGAVSERGQLYSQNDFLKVYNLDFCNNITTPRVIIQAKGKATYYTKLEAINRLLQYQNTNSNSAKGSRFIMYVTVNSNIFKDEELKKITNTEIKAYISNIAKLTKPEVIATRYMKAYCFSELTKIFTTNNFSVEFLPTISYLGSSYPNLNGGSKDQFHRMMTFTILGTSVAKGETPYQQDYSAFLNSKFVFANNKTISCFDDPILTSEITFDPNPQNLIKNSYTYKKLW